MDKTSYAEEEEKLRQLSACERLRPANQSGLTDQELQANLKIVFGSGELAAALPEDFVNGLLRRRVVSAVDQGDGVFDVTWVFQDGQDFNVFQPRLADAKVATPVKLEWAAGELLSVTPLSWERRPTRAGKHKSPTGRQATQS